jgi:hypothetical protein
MGEVYDHSLSIDHWSDRQGNTVQLGEIGLDGDEIVAGAALDEGDPSEEEFEGYTGNAGMTLERWYRRAAIVIWPRRNHFQVLASAGTDASIGGLQPLVKGLKRAAKSKREQQRRDCLDFACAIIDSWQAAPSYTWVRKGGMLQKVDAGRNVFPDLLCELDDAELVRRYLSQVMTADGQMSLGKPFIKLCKQHSWADFEDDLAALMDACTDETAARNARLLQTLCTVRDKNVERIELCTQLAQQAVIALERFDQRPPARSWQTPELDRGTLLGSLVKAMLAIQAETPLSRLIDHVLTCDKYDLTDAHLAAIFALEKQLAKHPDRSAAIAFWLAACRGALENCVAQAPETPKDFRRPNKLSCNCADCRALSLFLANPNEREGRFPLAKHRRQHLHQIIDSNKCDCTHVTERRGRPYTLVCTKTTASYDVACKTYDRDRKNLARVVALEEKLG